jgi:hypothetical protein
MGIERIMQYECRVCGRRIDVTRTGDVYEEPVYCCGMEATGVKAPEQLGLAAAAPKKPAVKKPAKKAAKKAAKKPAKKKAAKKAAKKPAKKKVAKKTVKKKVAKKAVKKAAKKAKKKR